MKDDILLEIDRKREREELLLPARRFAGENRKYLTLGVFKKSPKRVKSVPCPNGCGVSVKVLRQTERGYLVMCDHGEKESEDIYLPPEEVELYALDWVTFNALVENGTIDYYRPSTPEERWRDKKGGKDVPARNRTAHERQTGFEALPDRALHLFRRRDETRQSVPEGVQGTPGTRRLS